MMKEIFNKIKKWIKKNMKLILTIIAILIIVLLVALFTKKKEQEKFALNSIFDVYPEEVRELYSNVVEVSCTGDLYFDIPLDEKKVTVGSINRDTLLNYLFSHLEKKGLLNDELKTTDVMSITNNLFYEKIDLKSMINQFNYDGKVYTFEDGKLKIKDGECKVDKKYVSFLYGYSYNKDELSIDVNMGYLRDDILYDLSDKRLGKYDNKMETLQELFRPVSYYRYNYGKQNGNYKLKSIEWKSKI